MTISNLPSFYDMNFVTENKKLSSDAFLYLDHQFQILNDTITLLNQTISSLINQGTVTINGINPPSKTTAEITALFIDTSIPVGSLWYDSTIDKLKFKGSVAVQTITSV